MGCRAPIRPERLRESNKMPRAFQREREKCEWVSSLPGNDKDVRSPNPRLLTGEMPSALRKALVRVPGEAAVRTGEVEVPDVIHRRPDHRRGNGAAADCLVVSGV